MAATPTLVTAVFEPGHDRPRLPAVLSLGCPMAVYTDAISERMVRRLRGNRPTEVYVLDPAALEASALYAPVRRIRPDAAGLAAALSKPLWLLQQAQQNKFSSTHFYWIDADLEAPPELLRADSFVRLSRHHGRFLLLCRPHDAGHEINGFDAAALAALSGVERTRWVASGRLFGGAAESVMEIGAHYSQHLERTLNEGLLGNEESLLTLQSYADPSRFELQFIGRDGNVAPFLEQLAAGWPGDARAARDLLGELAETWIVSFNAPLQLERLLESLQATEPALLRTARRVLINNSTDPSFFPAYDELCARYGLEQVREGNHGIHGGRFRAAELFQRGGRHAMFWFEDDTLLVSEADPVQACENGLPRHVHGVAGAALGILQREFADYVKLSFTEKNGAHHTQRAWSAMEKEVREHYFPGALEAPAMAVSAVRSLAHVPYAVGEVSYGNWPHLVTRRGTDKLFFEERYESHGEQYWTARSFEVLRQGGLRAAVLLASPVEHRRTHSYARAERTDYRQVDGEIRSAPAVAPAAPRREWPLQPGTIFVGIAAYRDSELPHTLRDLFASAKHPERVFAGVFSQVVPGEDDDCLPGFIPDGAPAGHVRELRAHAAESLGACWARNRVFEELLQGEEFALQVDSHSRFEPGWDERLLEMLRLCPTPRAMLTHYPPSYTPPDNLTQPRAGPIAANHFEIVGILLLKGRAFDEPPPAPVPQAFLSAGFLFGPSAAFREVPYDPHLYFHGEEFSMAARLWTHGWDLYAPMQAVAYHDYENKRARRRNWDDRRDWEAINNRSFSRLRHLFGIEQSRDPVVLREMDRYGMGKARTLAEYEEYADINFAAQRIGPRAADGRYPAPPQPAALAMLRAARARYFKRVRDQDAMLETRSGKDSTLAATAVLRPALAKWLRDKGIRLLADAGCGDFNWMKEMDLGGLELYAGYDIVPELVADNQQLYGSRRGHFFSAADIVHAPLAACDAILCRRVLCEMPEEEALRALANLRASGARYLLASTRVFPGKDALKVRDLLSAPFNQPAPATFLPDGNGAALGVWPLKDKA